MGRLFIIVLMFKEIQEIQQSVTLTQFLHLALPECVVQTVFCYPYSFSKLKNFYHHKRWFHIQLWLRGHPEGVWAKRYLLLFPWTLYLKWFMSICWKKQFFFFAAVILSKQLTVNNFYQNSLFLLIDWTDLINIKKFSRQSA